MKYFEVTDKNFYEYIKKNRDRDPAGLRLASHGKNYSFPVEFAITQIEARKKTRHKLSLFNRNERFIYPGVLAAEQSTHQCVAAYHACLAGRGRKVLDMTAGLGIDAFTLSRAGNQVTAIELNADRAGALRHNADVLGLTNVEIVEGDSTRWIVPPGTGRHYDLIFIDPARRDADNRRTYLLKDCEPDVTRHIGTMRRMADRIMIKCSPILDINHTVRELPGVAEIHIVCVKGECKEVLVIIGKDETPDPLIHVADLPASGQEGCGETSGISLKLSETAGNCMIADTAEILPGTFLYDPNAGVHKLNCGAELCRRFGVKRMAPNTDLYFSDTLKAGFPGRTYRIISKVDRNSRKDLKGCGRDVAVRNYPLSADELRKKLKVSSDPRRYIYGLRTGTRNEPLLLDCEKIEDPIEVDKV